MKIIVSYNTDVGTTRRINQDSLLVKVVNSSKGRIAFAVICDGMGGLEQGELASKEVLVAFHDWFSSDFVHMVVEDKVSEEIIYNDWKKQVEFVNRKLREYSKEQGLMMGTTLTMLLVYQEYYYVCHVGDSRIYKIGSALRKITEDHTLLAQEVRKKHITEEQMKRDPRRNILLQCVGALDVLDPQFFSGQVKEDTTFVLCSDGFYHLITDEEIYRNLRPEKVMDKEQMKNTCKEMTRMAMNRGEKDNISVIGIVLKDVTGNGGYAGKV